MSCIALKIVNQVNLLFPIFWSFKLSRWCLDYLSSLLIWFAILFSDSAEFSGDVMYLWCCSEELWKSSALADIQRRLSIWMIFPQNIGRLIQLTPPIHFIWDSVYQDFFQSNSIIKHRVGENRILSVIYCVTFKDNAIF